jgi:hypothetical protein
VSARESIKRRVEALEAALLAGSKTAYRVRFAFYDPVPGEEEDWSIKVIDDPGHGPQRSRGHAHDC